MLTMYMYACILIRLKTLALCKYFTYLLTYVMVLLAGQRTCDSLIASSILSWTPLHSGQETGISSVPSARNRVCDHFTFVTYLCCGTYL